MGWDVDKITSKTLTFWKLGVQSSQIIFYGYQCWALHTKLVLYLQHAFSLQSSYEVTQVKREVEERLKE